MLVVIGELFIAASTYSDAWFWHTWGCLFQSLPCFLWNRWILNIRCMMNSLLVWTIFGRTIRNILGWFLRNWVHGSRACDRWCVKPWKSWMVCNYGGCASLKLIYAKSGLRWKTCCFHPRCGMHIVDFKYLLRLALHARAKRRGSDGPSPFALTGLCRVVDVYMIY